MAAINAEISVVEKRVQTLYRVSTKGQLDKNDIPMQKNACRDFIEKQEGWKLVREYSELGVSGFNKSAKDRDVIRKLQIDAEKGSFDVLLVFMFDRLGRKDDETPFLVEWFSKKGIEIWSAKEGEQRFDNHTDKLVNYLRYWQSSGESVKTSIRVNERHTQMVKEGLFRGGEPPYGYELTKSGLFNKKGKELNKLKINDDESKVIKEIYRLAYEEGYGGNRIANYLNLSEDETPTRTGTAWRASVVNYMLKNPIYKGYMTYNKSAGKSDGGKRNSVEDWVFAETANPEIIIIEENIWDKVQEKRAKKPTREGTDGEVVDRENYTTKSPLLFVGMIKCGHCGSPLTTTYNDKNWTTLDGVKHSKRNVKYRCSGKAQRSTECDGQTIYAKDKIENMVLAEVDVYLEQLRSIDLSSQVKQFKSKNMDGDVLEVKRLRKQLEEAYEELAVLRKEVPKSIMGKSKFNQEFLSGLIDEKDIEISELEKKIQSREKTVKDKKVEVDDMMLLKKYIPCWKEEFDRATIDKRKVMLGTLIDKIIVYRDKIEVKIKLELLHFIKASKDENGVQNQCKRERA